MLSQRALVGDEDDFFEVEYVIDKNAIEDTSGPHDELAEGMLKYQHEFIEEDAKEKGISVEECLQRLRNGPGHKVHLDRMIEGIFYKLDDVVLLMKTGNGFGTYSALYLPIKQIPNTLE
jgi:hypothetical protein